MIGAVVPAHMAEATIGPCLDALIAAGLLPEQIVVVDDGSSDATADLAGERGATVLRNDCCQGAAAARNRGAQALDSALILFVDADVVVAPDAVSRVVDAFAQDPGLTALFGSYDTAPMAPRAVSRYRNLLHHHVHQTAAREAETFWTGLGAVRRSAFDGVGGFNPDIAYMEDIDFGMRLKEQGARIQIDPKVQGTHLKEWTLGTMFICDWKRRAVPWLRLLEARGTASQTLNLSPAHRVNAALTSLTGLALLGAIFEPRLLAVAGLALVGFVLNNRTLFALLLRVGGLQLALPSIFFHAVHYAAALAGYAQVKGVERLFNRLGNVRPKPRSASRPRSRRS